MPIDQRLLDQIALSRDEYALLVQRLGREPNALELGIVGALWSGHCGYADSRPRPASPRRSPAIAGIRLMSRLAAQRRVSRR